MTAPAARQRALTRLDRYARDAVARSRRQYDRHGTLLAQAQTVFADPSIWTHPWVPRDHDFGRAWEHPVWQAMTSEQQLAWNHLQWGLDYARVAQGEMQLVDLNVWAVEQYRDVLPSVVALEEREAFEEQDHIDGFGLGLRALQERYLPGRPEALYSAAPSGFQHKGLNRMVRGVLGRVAQVLLGSNFPTLFFLNRGLKTHGFKPFEHAIANLEDGHAELRRLSHLHRLDESRHMASAHHLAELSNQVLDTVARDHWLVMEGAMRASWPRGRQLASRVGYWRTVLEHSPVFADLSAEARASLLAHVAANLGESLASPLPEKAAKLTLPTNKRLLEQADLSDDARRHVLRYLRGSAEHAQLVATVGEA